MATIESTERVEGSPVPPDFDGLGMAQDRELAKTTHRPRDPTAIHLPKPPRYSMTPGQLFAYWKKLDDIQPDRVSAYVYRHWPVIDKRWEDPKAVLYIRKETVAYPEPEEWRSELLHRCGSGNYKIILTDDFLSKGIGQTVITDLRDPEYPPVIDNLDELVMDDPANQSFLENLRQKGILPGQKEENDMAAGEMATALTGTIDKLTTKLAERNKEPQATAQPASATDAAKEAITMAREVFKDGIELGKASITAQADAKVAAVEAQAKAADPMTSFDTLTKLISVVQSLQPKPAEATAPKEGTTAELTSMVNSFMSREAALQGKIMEILQAQIAGMEARHTAAAAQVQAAAAPAPKQEDFFANLDKLVQAKDKLQTLFGGGGGEEVEREKKVPMWLQFAQSALAGLPTVATSLLAMSYNMAVAKTGTGAPILPAAPMPAADNPNPNPAIPGMGDNPTPTNDNALGGGAYAMLKQIERPLLSHLNDPTKSGADFAAALQDFHGRIAYDAIRELGKDTVVALLNSYPPIASILAQIPQRADEFIDDFLDADRILAEEGDGEGGEGEMPPVTVVPPIVSTVRHGKVAKV